MLIVVYSANSKANTKRVDFVNIQTRFPPKHNTLTLAYY